MGDEFKTTGSVNFSTVPGAMAHVEDFDIERVAANWERTQERTPPEARAVVAGMLLETALSLGQHHKVVKIHDSRLFKDSGWEYRGDAES
jgi:hypothetical protein